MYQNLSVGMISFNCFDKRNRKADIGYWLGTKYTGHGIMTKSVKTIVKIVFNDYGLNTIVINPTVDNIKSNSVAKNSGFQLDGTIRQQQLLIDGFHDENVWTLTRNDYFKVDNLDY